MRFCTQTIETWGRDVVSIPIGFNRRLGFVLLPRESRWFFGIFRTVKDTPDEH